MLKKVLFRPRSYVSGNFWIRNFFFANSASVHTYPVYPAYESVRQTGNFWIRYESGIAWTLIPDMFLSSDVTTSSPVLYHEYSRRCRARWVIACTLLGLQIQVITCGLLNLVWLLETSIMPNGGSTFWSFFPGRTDEFGHRKQVKTSEIVLGDDFVSETVIEEDWQ